MVSLTIKHFTQYTSSFIENQGLYLRRVEQFSAKLKGCWFLPAVRMIGGISLLLHIYILVQNLNDSLVKCVCVDEWILEVAITYFVSDRFQVDSSVFESSVDDAAEQIWIN